MSTRRQRAPEVSRTNRVAACLLVLLAVSSGRTAAAAPTATAVPPMILPQARIDRVDVSAWPRIRVLATILDSRGTPAEVKAITKLEVRDGKTRSRDPYIRFVNGAALDGRKDGKLRPASKAGVAHAAVIVVAGHQHDALRRGTLGRRLVETVGDVLKKFGKTDRGQVLWVGDRLRAWWDLKGRTTLLADVEESRKDCDAARAEALSGLSISMSGKEKQPPPGTDVCGLRDDIKDVGAALAGTSYEGFFPRLFGLGGPVYEHARYCKPPREALAGYGQITPENARMQKDKRDEAALRGETLDFETSAMDEALRLLLRDGRPTEEKVILLISDGKDGYLRDFDLCREAPPPSCAERSGKERERCVRDELGRRAIAAQADFRDKAVHWVGVARAAGVRIFAVGVGVLGERWEVDRLRLLAERSGGTYREATTEPDLAGVVGRTAAEVFDQTVIEFTHPAPEEAGPALSLALRIELDETMVSGDGKLETKAMAVELPEPVHWRQRAEDAVIDGIAAAQELLGYRMYVIVGIVLLVVITLVTALIVFLVVRAVVRGVRRLVSKVTG